MYTGSTRGFLVGRVAEVRTKVLVDRVDHMGRAEYVDRYPSGNIWLNADTCVVVQCLPRVAGRLNTTPPDMAREIISNIEHKLDEAIKEEPPK